MRNFTSPVNNERFDKGSMYCLIFYLKPQLVKNVEYFTFNCEQENLCFSNLSYENKYSHYSYVINTEHMT